MPTLIKYSEDELVSLLQQKNQQSFSYLYDNYCAALNGAIYRIVENTALAEDILQEAFVKIWNNIDNYDASRGRLFTWMLNIAKNLAIDTVRSKSYKKQSKIFNDENSVNNFQDANYGIAKFDALGLRKYVENLKPDLKRVIDLAYFMGYTQEEISRQMQMPLGTVKTKIRTAILELRKLMQYN